MNSGELQTIFKNVKQSPAVLDYIEKKIGKITPHIHDVRGIKCSFKIENIWHVVDIIISHAEGRYAGRGSSKDMYASIDLAVRRIEAQVHKSKKMKSNHTCSVFRHEESLCQKEGKRLKQEVTVNDLMTPKPFTVFEDDNLQFAEDIMQWRFIRHIPVVNESQRLVGLITHRDLLRASLSSLTNQSRVLQKKSNLGTPVKKIMRNQVLSISPHVSIREAAEIMLENKFGCLPVVKRGRVCGIITEADFVKYVVALSE